jgi:hypothetical protein
MVAIGRMPAADATGERHDLAFDRRTRRDAGADRRPFDMDGAGAALAETAAEARSMQAKFVSSGLSLRTSSKIAVFGHEPDVHAALTCNARTMILPLERQRHDRMARKAIGKGKLFIPRCWVHSFNVPLKCAERLMDGRRRLTISPRESTE